MKNGFTTLLRVEALGLLAGSVALYWYLGGSWWAFALFAILPDISLFAFLNRNGAARWPSVVYNVIHMYTTPIVLLILLWPYHPLFLLGWFAHIAADRVFGFGFKGGGVAGHKKKAPIPT